MVKVNGEEKNLAGTSISDFLKTTTFNLKFIAVEINEQIIPKAKYGETIIQDNDSIEVVSFVGGG
ncbi:MAG: sulfur carrier protein ThiS [Treponema sp.]|nr:sulfur carrier protein ThiS [Treponema sp.]